MHRQKTLEREISCSGIGLHTGRRVNLTLKPSSANHGIVFRRLDRSGIEIPATVDRVVSVNHATSLARGDTTIGTVEHLLSALAALRVDNAIVELDAGEVPVMDGSAAPFISLIHRAGIRDLAAPCSFIRVLQPVIVAGEKQFVAVYPSEHLRVTYTIQFDHPLLQNQSYSVDINGSSFTAEIAPARTFGFLEDVETLRRNGLALGGSLDNAVVLSETGVLNDVLRYPDEFVRHKILDMLGDLALLGCPLMAHVVALRAGHGLHTKLVRAILASPESWELVTAPEPVLQVAPQTVPIPLPIAPTPMAPQTCAWRQASQAGL